MDMPALVLTRMLRALPSRIPFPVQILLLTWNGEGRQPVLQPNDDLMIVDGLLSQLPLSAVSGNVPVLTRYQASFVCDYCGRIDDSCEDWEERNFVSIPTLHMTPGIPSTVEDLLNGMLQQQMRIRCPNRQCRERVIATWRTVNGTFSVFYIDRADLRGGVHNTRLLPRGQTSVPGLGELVSVISRTGDGYDGGHFVSYHQVGGRWFLNDDDHTHHVCNFHPFNGRGQENVSLLCYYNHI